MKATEPELLEPLLSVEDVARLLRVHRSSVYRFVREGELRPLRVRADLRFEPDEIRAYLARRREASP